MDQPVPAEAGGQEAELWQHLQRSRPWRLRRRHLPWLGLMALAAALRLAGITSTSVWHDEAMTIHTARMDVHEQVVEMSVANNQPPLFFLLVKLWAVVSWSPLWLRLMSVGISMLGVACAVWWLRLWDRRAAWMAGVLTATSPLMIHYAQEIRAYALLYTCTLAGLYYGERLARADLRRARAGLLACACALSYAHYIGSLIAAALWVYTWIRGTGLRRTVILAAAWGALVGPVLTLGLFHVSDKMETGFWVPPVGGSRLLELVVAWTGHLDLDIWQGSGGARAWAALGLSTLLSAGIGLALFTSPARQAPGQRIAAGSMFAAGFTFVALVVAFSLATVPVALERTTFPTFIPLIGAMALSCAPASRGWARTTGTVSCLAVASIWTFTWLVRVYDSPERRPPEETLFEPIAEALLPGDVVIAFPAEMQASAAYFLKDRATARQICSTDMSRLEDTGQGLRLKPLPRRRSPAWFGDFLLAVTELGERHPHLHGVWLVDTGPRSAGNQDRLKVREWLDRRYVPAESFSCGTRWTLTAQHYLPADAGEAAGTDTEATD